MDVSDTQEKSELKKLDKRKVDANPNKISATETAKFIQMIDLNSEEVNTPSVSAKLKQSQNTSLQLSVDTQEATMVSKIANLVKSKKLDTSKKSALNIDKSIVSNVLQKTDKSQKSVSHTNKSVVSNVPQKMISRRNLYLYKQISDFECFYKK